MSRIDLVKAADGWRLEETTAPEIGWCSNGTYTGPTIHLSFYGMPWHRRGRENNWVAWEPVASEFEREAALYERFGAAA